MSRLCAKIHNGLVINTQVIEPEDDLERCYNWINITGLCPMPGVGWTYDGASFSPPAAPAASKSDLDTRIAILPAAPSSHKEGQIRRKDRYPSIEVRF
jgi:hypothetical protein